MPGTAHRACQVQHTVELLLCVDDIGGLSVDEHDRDARRISEPGVMERALRSVVPRTARRCDNRPQAGPVPGEQEVAVALHGGAESDVHLKHGGGPPTQRKQGPGPGPSPRRVRRCPYRRGVLTVAMLE